MRDTIWALILAGGAGSRVGHRDKALIPFRGTPLIEHVVQRVTPQVESIVISANRNFDDYRRYTRHVVSDTQFPEHGPLAGILNAAPLIESKLLLIVACDTPNLPTDLVRRLAEALSRNNQYQVSVARTADGIQPLTALIKTEALHSLRDFLASGKRKVQDWYATLNMVTVDFNDCPASFANLNTPHELLMPIVLGFAGYSGAGKTTLLEQVVSQLAQREVRVAVIKHAHHRFDIDHPGKDSYRLRKAGATQMLVASSQRWALMTETPNSAQDPILSTLLAHLDPQQTDLVLVEGFKHEAIPKIEVYRAELGKPQLYPFDAQIIAVASDTALICTLPLLDLNNPRQITEFIVNHFLLRNGTDYDA